MSATVAVEKPVAVVDVVVLLLPHRAGRRRSRQFGRKAIIVIKYFMLYFVRLFHVHTHTHRISIPFRCPIRSLVFLGLMLAYACTFFFWFVPFFHSSFIPSPWISVRFSALLLFRSANQLIVVMHKSKRRRRTLDTYLLSLFSVSFTLTFIYCCCLHHSFAC